MKSLIFILSLLLFIYATKKAPGVAWYYHSYADTSILGPVVSDQAEPDTNSLPPPDTLPIPPSGPRSNLIFEELYNDLPLDAKVFGFGMSSGSCCAWSQALSATFFNTSPTSNRFEIKINDPVIAGSPRSEDNYPSTGEPALNFTRWMGLKYYFPASYIADRAPEIIHQFHHASGTGNPPVAIWTKDDHLWFAYNGGLNQDYGLIPKSQWVSFVFHIIWDTDVLFNGADEGLIEIWMNGVLLTSKSGKNSDPLLTKGPYPKWGIYKWPWSHLAVNGAGSYTTDTDDRILYIDDVRYGNANATYADVVPD